RLLLHVIHYNGSITEINYNNTDEIQDINYCIINGFNPIKIYLLFSQFILVTYTHAANTSNNITFMDKVIIGFILYDSALDFGPSYLSPSTNYWIQYELKVYSSFKKGRARGFLHLSAVSRTNDFKWRQYAQYVALHCVLASLFLTSNDEYVIIYTDTTIKTTNNALAPQFIGIYAIILDYNQTITPQRMVLYELLAKDLTFTGLSCSVGFDHLCIASVVCTQTTQFQNVNATTTSDNFYVRIRLLPSKTIVSLDPMLPTNNGSLVTNVKKIPYRGYALSINDNFLLKQINTNFDGAFDVLQNNTILVALNGTATSWKIFLFDLLPYSQNSNVRVRAMYPSKNNTIPLYITMIFITFDDIVSSVNLTIYQMINQTVIPRHKGYDYESEGISREIIMFNVPNYTFNDQYGQYFIQIDYRYRNYPLPYYDKDIREILQLTTEGTSYFQKLNDSRKKDFLITLIEELTLIIHIEKGRLESNEFHQSTQLKTLISLSIHKRKGGEELTTE
ncbi:12139_t:CDS:2, partial [Gigaspora margarita]